MKMSIWDGIKNIKTSISNVIRHCHYWPTQESNKAPSVSKEVEPKKSVTNTQHILEPKIKVHKNSNIKPTTISQSDEITYQAISLEENLNELEKEVVENLQDDLILEDQIEVKAENTAEVSIGDDANTTTVAKTPKNNGSKKGKSTSKAKKEKNK